MHGAPSLGAVFLEDDEKAKPVATLEERVRQKISWPRISLQNVSSQKTCVCSLYDIMLVNTCFVGFPPFLNSAELSQ
jgi:hypothetical protein